jgi:hypothetical protein
MIFIRGAYLSPFYVVIIECYRLVIIKKFLTHLETGKSNIIVPLCGVGLLAASCYGGRQESERGQEKTRN